MFCASVFKFLLTGFSFVEIQMGITELKHQASRSVTLLQIFSASEVAKLV